MKKYLTLLFLLLAFSVQARPGLLDSLGLSNEFDTPPSADEVFIFSAKAQDSSSLTAHWVVAEGNYLYRDKIHFEIIQQEDVQLQKFSLPAGEEKMDEAFGLTDVYQYDTDIILPINRSSSAQEITLKAYYQGCSETFHICYPPTEKEVLITLPPLAGDVQEKQAITASASTPPISEQDRLTNSLKKDSFGEILLLFFGVGLLLSFTPCVFPMIPILSSIIVGEGDKITTSRAFSLSLAYVLAMSVTYTVAGVMTGLLGENIQALFQNPWIIGSFSALFVVLSLSMFGLFELQLPQALQNRLHQISQQQKGGKIVGAALMGLLSGLIVGPCLAPPLAAALIFIGQHGDPVLGGSALFALSMGMGIPLLVIGTSAGTLLPKAGNWMDTIKSIFGVMMLALAIWMLERIIPGWISLLLWGGLLIVTAVYLGALNTLSIDSNGWEKLWKGLGLILLIYGGMLMIGGASGGHNVWQPLHTVSASSTSVQATTAHVNFTQVSTRGDLEQQLAQTNQASMLDFYADWCVECKRMEITTFQDPTLISTLKNITPLQLDMTANNAEHKALMKQYGVFAPPTLLFFDKNGKEYTQHRLVGSISAADLTQHIETLPSVAK